MRTPRGWKRSGARYDLLARAALTRVSTVLWVGVRRWTSTPPDRGPHRVGALTRGACAPSLSPDGNVTKTIRIHGDRGVPRRRGPLRYRRLEVADPPRRRPQSRKAAEIADRVDVSAGRRKGRLTTNEMVGLFFQLKGVPIAHTFIVARHLSEEVIIGTDLIQFWKIRPDPVREDRRHRQETHPAQAGLRRLSPGTRRFETRIRRRSGPPGPMRARLPARSDSTPLALCEVRVE